MKEVNVQIPEEFKPETFNAVLMLEGVVPMLDVVVPILEVVEPVLELVVLEFAVLEAEIYESTTVTHDGELVIRMIPEPTSPSY